MNSRWSRMWPAGQLGDLASSVIDYVSAKVSPQYLETYVLLFPNPQWYGKNMTVPRIIEDLSMKDEGRYTISPSDFSEIEEALYESRRRWVLHVFRYKTLCSKKMKIVGLPTTLITGPFDLQAKLLSMPAVLTDWEIGLNIWSTKAWSKLTLFMLFVTWN